MGRRRVLDSTPYHSMDLVGEIWLPYRGKFHLSDPKQLQNPYTSAYRRRRRPETFAAEDIKHHITTLQALKSTFARISDLEKDYTSHDWVRQPLSSRLQGCLLDLQAMERFVKPLHNELQNGKSRRTWTKTKWAAASQRQKIERFMARIESYYLTFSMDLILVNTRLALQSSTELSSSKEITVGPPNSAQNEAQDPNTTASQVLVQRSQGQCSSFVIKHREDTVTAKHCYLLSARPEKALSDDIGQPRAIDPDHTLGNTTGLLPLGNTSADSESGTDVVSHPGDLVFAPSSRLEATSCRKVFIWTSENPLLPFSWWLGQINAIQSMTRPATSPKTLRIYQGYAAGVAVTLPWGFALWFELSVYFWRKAAEPSLSCSIDCHLSFPAVVSWDSQSVRSAMCGDVDAMKAEFGAKEATPFDILPDGSTLLHLAAMQNHFDMTKFLIEQGARVNATNGIGESAVHRAIELAKDYRITSLLLAHGADLCVLTIDRKTALHTFFNQAVEQTLLTYNPGPFCSDFLAPDRRGRTLLHYLSWSSKCSPETFKLVQARGPDLLSGLDREGKSVLHFSTQRGNAALVAYVLSVTSNAPDVNGQDCRGKAPVHYAVESRRATETVRVLAQGGADVRARDDEGRLPLHLAAKRDNLVAARALLEICPEPASELRVVDSYGMTPLDLAMQSGSETVRTYFQDLSKESEGGISFPQQAGVPKEYSPYCCPTHRYRSGIPSAQAACTCGWTNGVGGSSRESKHIRVMVQSYVSIAVIRVRYRLGLVILSIIVVALLGMSKTK
ncbi:MAG: hypothetical protein Q9181_005063 [Wetmoreana brouardii]